MNPRASQSGMALLVSLILLLLLTIIAITAATRSSLQERMAANSQQQNVAFQAAESGIQGWIDSYLSNPRIQAISVTPPNTSDWAGKVKYSATAAVPGTCATVVPAYSLNGADGGGTFQYACFNIESTGKSCADTGCTDASNPARAKHLQGYLVRY
ncbi:pilus assembly PilX family protein [Pseudomonas citronellolis]|uniref:pilus assembly PilX family protein n=1 Tax=Pseudomonas citronellolis TaxID=53408 RepID=UPI0021C1529B|nr:pilus assembly PilX N-terminal domain-containing protein [Pseudomonas citronellolis]MDN6871388.1 pilus assembly PilX N-terminal domain-containing protein [Pseudomonas citronellolis]UXJ51806.1 pilus assembly PilX N-terminal domain-containing protein [Pseudomonas citronellolis]